MAIRVTRYFSWDIVPVPERLVANWVHRDIVDDPERTNQSRLLALLLVVGTALASVFPFTLIPAFGAQAIAAPILGLSAGALGLAGILMQTGRRLAVEIASLVFAATGLCAAGIATGGLASPILPLLLLLPAECYRLTRNRTALAIGFASAAGVVALLAAAKVFVPLELWRGAASDVVSITVIAVLGIYGVLFVARQSAAQSEADTQNTSDNAAAAVFDRLPGLISLHDVRGHVVSVSGAHAPGLLDSVGDVTGRGLVEHMHVSDRIRFLQAIDRMRTGCDTQLIEVRMRKDADDRGKDQFLHLSMQLAALRDNGVFSGFMAQSTDNGAGIKLRHDLVRKTEEAEAANEAKTRFLAAVSHELRTPLNAILGFSDLLSGEFLSASLSAEQREYVSLIRQSGQHLLEVINSMLDLSKIEAGRYELNLETFNIREVVETCEAMLAQQASGKNIVLNARVARGDRKITACRRALQQILINLMANAIKFTEDDGIVTIDVSEQDGWVNLTVSDTGIGIAQTDLERIGAPFVQVESQYARQYQGTGLGLSLVKGLVALHGGRFHIESAVKIGTTVTVSLPVNGPQQTRGDVDTDTSGAIEFPPRLTRKPERKMETRHGQAKTA
ncbi:MAG: HAMP domain-containing histidine kinase [Hyphomicrobiales bacterium]|nr:HAMP domain-containing histidine kinase [Hyphomicrobiales bacterium]